MSGVSGRNVLSGRRGAWMNGNGKWAAELCGLLERLTVQRRLDVLTMVAWRGVLPTPRVLSLTRQWCPVCYGTMRAECGECWDPLVWSLGAVLCCLEHGERLHTKCVSCLRKQPWLPRDTCVGWCAWCGVDLAAAGTQAGAEGPWDNPAVTVADRWRASVCGDLVAWDDGESGPVVLANVGRRIEALLHFIDGGNQSAFARRMGVSLPTPGNWMSTGNVRFDYLIRICWRTGLHPLDLLVRERSFDDALWKTGEGRKVKSRARCVSRSGKGETEIDA